MLKIINELPRHEVNRLKTGYFAKAPLLDRDRFIFNTGIENNNLGRFLAFIFPVMFLVDQFHNGISGSEMQSFVIVQSA